MAWLESPGHFAVVVCAQPQACNSSFRAWEGLASCRLALASAPAVERNTGSTVRAARGLGPSGRNFAGAVSSFRGSI